VAGGGDGAGLAADDRFWAAVESGDLAGLAGTLEVDERLPFGEVLPVLASWRRRERDDLATAAWRYQVTWVPLPGAAAGSLDGTWLVVAPGPQAELGERVAAVLAAAGARAVTVPAGEAGGSRAGLAARVAEAADGPVAGVVSLLALDEAPLPGQPGVRRAWPPR
jgi:hypothetical protein